MDKQIDLTVPVNFEKIKEYQIADSRFIQCKIFLMHLGQNLNGSLFKKDVVEKAIPTLANTPILGYIENNHNGDDDFSDHRAVLERKNGEIKVSYKGKAIGVIPESNDAHFELRMCDDGVEREFLTCNGLLWSKFDDSTDIFIRDSSKQQSMELDENYSGHYDDDNYFNFDSFKFYGACALGDDVFPAMHSASIETKFTMNEIQAKLEQFTNFINNQSHKEVDIDNLRKEDEILTDVINEAINETIEKIIDTNISSIDKEVIESPTDTNEVIEEVENSNTIIVEMIEKSEFIKLQEEFDEYKSNYSFTNSEVERLQNFEKTTILEKFESQVSEVFAKFDKQLNGTIEFESLKNNYNGLEVETIEEKLFALLGKKNANFSVKPKDTIVKLAFDLNSNEEIDDQYGGILAKVYNK